MRCSNCGCENESSAKTCQVCGCQLSEECDSNISKYETDKKDEIHNEQKKPDKSKIIIIALIATIMIVIIVAVAIIVNLANKNDDTYNNSLASTSFDSNNENTDSEAIVTEEATEIKTTVATTLSEKEATKQKALEYLKKADDALKNGEREGALQMADAALSLYNEEDIDDDIQKKYDEICEYAPLELFYQKNILKEDPKPNIGHNIDYIGSDNSNDGTLLPNCFTIMHNEDADGCLSEITYNLNGKYNIVTGTGYIPSYSKNVDQQGSFVVFGDGKRLYTSPTFNSGVLPESFEINVTGVDRLVVAFYAKPYNGGGLSSSNYFSNFGISDFKALKDLP